MGRKIFITSDMCIDERLIEVAEQDAYAALLWPWILTALDDWGRGEANVKRLKAQIFPANDAVTYELIETAIRLYAQFGLLQLYEADGKQYMAVPSNKWFKYQTHIRHDKRTNDNSRYPAPPNDINENCAQMRADASNVANMHTDERNCIPSPSPSPSPTTTTTYSPPPSGGDSGPQDVHHTETLSTGSTDSSETNDGLTVAVKAFEGYGYGTVNFGISEALTDLVTEYGGEWVKEALYEGMLQGRRTLKYVEGILQRWRREGGPNHSLAHSRDRPELEGVRAKPYQVLAGGDEL